MAGSGPVTVTLPVAPAPGPDRAPRTAAVDLDPCLVRTPEGELLASGHVREHDADTLLVEAEQYAGGWLERGDTAVVEVLSADRGACTYDAVVESSGVRRILLVGVRLRHRVQQRTAVRAATDLPFTITEAVVDGEIAELTEPLDVVVLDVSATGLRFRSTVDVPPGTQLVLTFTATRVPVRLVLEVLRQQPARTDLVHGCRFEGLSERDADELFTYVLAEQRRQLARRAAARV